MLDTVKIGILQPGYLPWLGFFEQVYSCDVFVLYDDVQYDKHGWRNRNRIKAVNGLQWLTVPVKTKGSGGQLIRDVQIDHSGRWNVKHLRSLEVNYQKAPCYDRIYRLCRDVLSVRYEKLIDLDLAFLGALLRNLNIKTRIVLASSLNLGSGDRLRRLIDICHLLKANTFYEGRAGEDYIDISLFDKEGIKVLYQDYQHPTYPQLHGDFVSHLSIIDLLMNCGDMSLEILTKGAVASGRKN